MELHPSFKLSALSETIFLVGSDGNILDEVSYTEQKTDESYGRYPNGTGDFREMSPTFEAENVSTVATDNETERDFELLAFPNPAKEYLYLELSGLDESQITIYDVIGVQLFNELVSGSFRVNTSNWEPGVYFVKCEHQVLKIFVL